MINVSVNAFFACLPLKRNNKTKTLPSIFYNVRVYKQIPEKFDGFFLKILSSN